MDSDEASVSGMEGGSSNTMTKKKQVGMSRSVSNNSRTENDAAQVHSPSLMWSYNSNWSDDLSPPHIMPPYPLNGHQSWLGLGTTNSRADVSLIVPEMPSPNISNRESRPLGFRRGRGRGVWSPPGTSTPMSGNG